MAALIASGLLGKILSAVPIGMGIGALLGGGVAGIIAAKRHDSQPKPSEFGLKDPKEFMYAIMDPGILAALRAVKAELFPQWRERSVEDYAVGLVEAYVDVAAGSGSGGGGGDAKKKKKKEAGGDDTAAAATATTVTAGETAKRLRAIGSGGAPGEPTADELAPFQRLVRSINDLMRLYHMITNIDKLRHRVPTLDNVPWKLRSMDAYNAIEAAIMALSHERRDFETNMQEKLKTKQYFVVPHPSYGARYVFGQLIGVYNIVRRYDTNIQMKAQALEERRLSQHYDVRRNYDGDNEDGGSGGDLAERSANFQDQTEGQDDGVGVGPLR